MPELPEVETVKETLKRQILHKKITGINILYSKIIETNLHDFYNLIDQEFMDIKRRGKWLIFELNDYYLVVHLRMEGKFFIKKEQEPINKHEHIIFTLDSCTLRYHDTRKFGKMYLVDKDRLYLDTPLCKIGLEPWDPNLNYDYLKKYYDKNIPIKTLLLNQEAISGIGNIYADEILFLSQINPYTKGSSLRKKDYDNIIINTQKILTRAIELGGTTIRSYTSSLGVTGRFQSELMVHNKENELCSICHSPIIKTTIGGRGTYYCPICQKERKDVYQRNL